MSLRRALAMPALAVALMLAGCGTDPVVESAPAEPSASSIVSSGLARTEAAGPMRLSLELLTTVDGVDDAISGTALASVDGANAQAEWRSQVGATKEIVVDGRVFVQLLPPDGAWLLAPTGTPTSAALAVFRDLADLQELRIEGSESVNGATATRLTGWIPAAEAGPGMGLNPAAEATVAADAQARVDVAVWVGEEDQGHIVRVMRTLRTTAPISAATFVDVLQTGVVVEPTVPEAYDTAM